MPPNIISGPLVRPEQVLLFGVEGLGKTTFVTKLAAAYHRHPLIIDTEFGTRLPCDRVHVHSMREWDETLGYLIKEKHQFDTLIVDTITSFEPLVEAERILTPPKYTDNGKKILRMGDFPYGRGSILLREEFDRIIFNQLDELVRHGIAVWMVGHSQVVRVNLPELIEGFDKYELAMDKRVSATLRQWVDHVFFCNWNTKFVINETDQSRGISGKERILYTQHSATHDAKTRAGLAPELPWDVASLAPLFASAPIIQPATNAVSAAGDHAQRWAEVVSKINGDNHWSAEALGSFLKNRFPSFAGDNYEVIPREYLERALAHTEAFKTTIGEFLHAGATQKTTEATGAQPA